MRAARLAYGRRSLRSRLASGNRRAVRGDIKRLGRKLRLLCS